MQIIEIQQLSPLKIIAFLCACVVRLKFRVFTTDSKAIQSNKKHHKKAILDIFHLNGHRLKRLNQLIITGYSNAIGDNRVSVIGEVYVTVGVRYLGGS